MDSEVKNAVRLIADFCKAQEPSACIEHTCPIVNVCLKNFSNLPETWELKHESNTKG